MNFRPQRNRGLIQFYAHVRSVGQFVERTGQPAPGRVAHPADRGTFGQHHPRQIVQRCGVAFEHRFEFDPFANRQDGDPMIAEGARNQDFVARPGIADGEAASLGQDSHARGGDEDLVALATIDHLGIAGDDRYAGFGAGFAHGGHDPPQVGHRQTFLQNKCGRKIERRGAADGQIVDRAMHGQSADVAAGEKRRPDHEGIGCQRDPGGAVPVAARGAQSQCGLVFQNRWRLGTIALHEHPLDQVGGQRSAAAVAQQHVLVVDHRRGARVLIEVNCGWLRHGLRLLSAARRQRPAAAAAAAAASR